MPTSSRRTANVRVRPRDLWPETRDRTVAIKAIARLTGVSSVIFPHSLSKESI
jgi:hypothetical protein